MCCEITGESEKHLREAFEAAHKLAQEQHPTLLFLDELDSIAPLRSSQQPHEARVVAQLLTLLDGATTRPGELEIPPCLESSLSTSASTHVTFVMLYCT